MKTPTRSGPPFRGQEFETLAPLQARQRLGRPGALATAGGQNYNISRPESAATAARRAVRPILT